MTTLADFLRDSAGTLWKIYASGDGEIIVTTGEVTGLYNGWTQTTYNAATWTEATYSIPTSIKPTVRTLADSAGTTWYMYMDPEGALVLSTTEPSAVPGTWTKYDYGLDETEASTGDEVYLKVDDISGTDWFVYPSVDGEYILTTTEPS